MTYFNITEAEKQKRISNAHENMGSPNVDPGFFGGSFYDYISAPINAAYYGTVGEASKALSGIAHETAKSFDYWFDTNTADSILESKKYNEAQLNSLRPDHRTTGAAIQIIYSFSEMAAQAAIGSRFGGIAGSATSVGVQQASSEFDRLIESGVDKSTAANAAGITGITAAVGVSIPMSFGFRLTGKAKALSETLPEWMKPIAINKAAIDDIAMTTGINVSTGMAHRGFSYKELHDNGYHDLAKQYDILDNQALAIDSIMGLAFGGLGRYIDYKSSPKINQDVIDAALALNAVLHMETNSPFGVPTTFASRDAHIKSINEALASLAKGDKVDVTSIISNAEFMTSNSINEFNKIVFDSFKEIYPDIPDYKINETIESVSGKNTQYNQSANDVNQFNDDFSSLDNIIVNNPDIEVSIENLDGSFVRRKASEVIADADLDIEFAKNDSKLFDVAATCLWRSA